MKPGVNSVGVHPQLNNYRLPMDGALLAVHSLSLTPMTYRHIVINLRDQLFGIYDSVEKQISHIDNNH